MRWFILILSALLVVQVAQAQLSSEDIALIKSIDRHDHKFDSRKPKLLKIGNSAITKYNPVSLTFSGALFVYQKLISPQLQSSCPYELSCSAFSKASIEHFGLLKGVALSADRLTRCTQFSLIDILPSQRNLQTGFIIDPVAKYSRIKKHSH